MIRGPREEAASVPPLLPLALCIYIQHRHQSGPNCHPGRLLEAGRDVKTQEPGGGEVGQTGEGCFLHCKMYHLSRNLVQSAGNSDTYTRHCCLQRCRGQLCDICPE